MCMDPQPLCRDPQPLCTHMCLLILLHADHGSESGVRAPAEILTMLLSPRPHTRPQHSHLLLVGWGKADTASPEHGAREDVFEKFLLRQGLTGELWHQMTRVPVLALLLPSCVTLNELPNHSGLSFPHL